VTLRRCPVCEHRRLTPFLLRSRVPVHQNLIVARQDAARLVTRGELDLVACDSCGFVFNRAFDLSLLGYGEDYDNTQSCSAYFDAYMDGLVRGLVEDRGVRNSTIVEVGCGDGRFLRKLVDYPGAGNTGVGFDPSYVGADTGSSGRLTFRRCYYDETSTAVAADVVVCRHVIEHVPEPMALLRSVRMALADSREARVFFETPCVEWILRNGVVWDLFYEHCSLFTAASLTLAFERAGFSVDCVEHIFGGQYLWLEGRLTGAASPAVQMCPDTAALARDYGANEARLRQEWQARLLGLKAKGEVAVWGAGAKGVTFVNLVDPDCAIVDCLVDLNPNKQGRYVPGTGHPIVALADLPRRGVERAVLMNPNYREENLRLLAEAGIGVELTGWSA
jgi:2-polyprenyl-3-methyl-5-hydroxy-6-metoxy-1,4-benzoquinol methylase